MTKENSWTLQLNQLVMDMTSMFEKVQAHYSSLILSYLHVVLEKKSTTHNFFLFSTCTNSCFNEEGHGGQNENQPDISTARKVHFYNYVK